MSGQHSGTVTSPLKQKIRTELVTAAKDALEEAAKICDHWAKQNHVYVNGAIQCAKDIRTLKDSL